MKAQITRILGGILLSVLALNTLAADTVWIDVRSLKEYQADHIEGHYNIPHNRIAEQVNKYVKNKDTTINLYCRSGRRAGIAKQALETLGYTHTTNVGGIADARKLLTHDKTLKTE